MYNAVKFLIMLCVLVFCSSVYAIEVYEPSFIVETCTSYEQMREARGLTFDGVGNLYVTHDRSGSILRITPNGTVSEFVTGLKYPVGIVWGGLTNFGDHLYLVDSETFRGDLIQIGRNSQKFKFTNLSADAPSPVCLDRTGKYGGALYVGSTGNDCIYQIDSQGKESVFSSFPYSRSDGGPASIAVDITGNYNGLMYVATSYRTEKNADVSGLFSIDTHGKAGRFTKDIVCASCIAFAPNCAFNEFMYVIGKNEFDASLKLWKIDPDGHATIFASTCNEIAFGLDGSLYVSEFSKTNNRVTISRIRNKNLDIK
jgi:hypothetical protein